MTEYDNQRKLALNEWNVESLRYTVFPLQAEVIDGRTWWDMAVGEPPESINEQPKARAVNLSGQYVDGILALTVRPMRIDLEYQGRPTGPVLPGPPTIADYAGALKTFSSLIDSWHLSGGFPIVRRLAFGSVLLHFSTTQQESARLIDAYLPSVDIDPNSCQDFVYQINRPVKSQSIDRLTINRLSKWSVGVSRSGQITAGGSLSKLEVDAYFGRIELDINTDPRYGASFDAVLAKKALSELTDYSKQVVEVGDSL